MEQLLLWITPALVLGLFAWFRFTFRDLKENMNARMTDTVTRIDELKTEMRSQLTETNRRFDNLTTEMNQRFDQVNRELADNAWRNSATQPDDRKSCAKSTRPPATRAATACH